MREGKDDGGRVEGRGRGRFGGGRGTVGGRAGGGGWSGPAGARRARIRGGGGAEGLGPAGARSDGKRGFGWIATPTSAASIFFSLYHARASGVWAAGRQQQESNHLATSANTWSQSRQHRLSSAEGGHRRAYPGSYRGSCGGGDGSTRRRRRRGTKRSRGAVGMVPSRPQAPATAVLGALIPLQVSSRKASPLSRCSAVARAMTVARG